MKWSGPFLAVLTIFLMPAASQAVSLSWGGSLEAGVTGQARQESTAGLLPQTIWAGQAELRLEIMGAASWSGTVALFGRLECPGREEDSYPSSSPPPIKLAFADCRLNDNFLLRLGRQRIGWGTGLAWNPTNYLGADENRADLSAALPGVDAVMNEVVWPASSLALAFAPSGGGVWGEALRFGWQAWQSDFSLSAFSRGEAGGVGGDFAKAFGGCTVYGEMAWKRGDGRLTVVRDEDGYREEVRPPDRYYLHGLLGMSYVSAAGATILLEYYHNQAGWNDSEAWNYSEYWPLDTDNSIARQRLARFFGDLRQNYLYGMIRGDMGGNLSLSMGALWNLDDRSSQLLPMIEYKLGSDALVSLSAFVYEGDMNSEFGSLPWKSQVSLRLILDF